MPIALHRYFNSGRTPAGKGKELVARLAKVLACGSLIVTAAYFAVLYLLSSR
jgi:hypothetical protein